MRYMIITYIQRPMRRGIAAQREAQTQQDEMVEVSKRLRNRDISQGSVILDFAQRQVIKASVGDQSAPRDFQRIRDYYYQYYKDLIDQLEQIHSEKQDNPG